MATGMRTCNICKETKSLEAFSKDISTPGGIEYRCKSCNRERWYLKHYGLTEAEVKASRFLPEGFKRCSRCKRAKRHKLFSKDSQRSDGFQCWCKACERRRYRRNRVKDKDNFYRRNYNTTYDEVESKRHAQGGKCAICKEVKPLGVDHSHETGKFRGLLCDRCNFGLGKFKDSAVLLGAAIEYLQS